MKNQITDIYTHDNELYMAHKINNIELDNCIIHLNYVKSELNNLLVFYSSHETQQVKSKESLIERFEIRRVDNNVLLKSFSNYKNKREQLAECEDIECDMIFIKEHESYRRMYLFHIDKYRKLKDRFFNEIQGKLNLAV